MISASYFGLGQNGDLSLWCRNDGVDEVGRTRFWVINGHWLGDWDGKVMCIEYTGDKQPMELMWMGEVPFDDDEYNEAMAFIRETNWSKNMTTEKMTFDGVLDTGRTVEHNSNVTNLAAAYKQLDAEVERLKKQLDKATTNRDLVYNYAKGNTEFNTEEVNKLLREVRAQEFKSGDIVDVIVKHADIGRIVSENRRGR